MYKPLNPKLPNKRESNITKQLRKQKLSMNQRFDFNKGMYGNVFEIVDHERKIYYRQDREIIEQMNLFDEPLPRYCDFCEKVVDEIKPVEYTAVYEMIVRPNTDPTIKRDERKIIFASCRECESEVIIPEKILSGYIVELYREGKLIWKRSLLHYNGKLTMPWTAI